MNNKNKHLSRDDRHTIEAMLDSGEKLYSIALEIGKHKTTISKEIKLHRTEVHPGYNTGNNNLCMYYRTCTHTRLCDNANCRYSKCKLCNICNSICTDFVKESCSRHERFPYVCNGCENKKKCRKKIRYYYKSRSAHDAYLENLSSSRQGISISKDELDRIDDIITPLVKKSQSIDHILITHGEEINLSRTTLYTYIHENYLGCRDIDLPRKVKYKPRRAKNSDVPIHNTKLRKGRTYDDFVNYMKANPDAHVVELDTLEGIKGEPILMTLHDVHSHLQIAHLIKSKDPKNIRDVFNLYRERINDDELFTRYFKVILTDNGSEFSDIVFLEELGIKVFFCDPGKSYQKGACERNHEFIRFFIPKGRSFAHLKQGDIWMMMSHINSYCRKSLNNKSPYEVAAFIWGDKLLQALHMIKFKPDEVILNNSIFKHKE